MHSIRFNSVPSGRHSQTKSAAESTRHSLVVVIEVRWFQRATPSLITAKRVKSLAIGAAFALCCHSSLRVSMQSNLVASLLATVPCTLSLTVFSELEPELL